MRKFGKINFNSRLRTILWGRVRTVRKVVVLMSTYNGEKYLPKQMESCLNKNV